MIDSSKAVNPHRPNVHTQNGLFHIVILIFSSWNEWLKLPIKYPDLPRHAQVCFTIWDVYGPRKAIPVGGTTVSLFGKHG